MKELARGGLLHLDERSVTGGVSASSWRMCDRSAPTRPAGPGWYGSERIVFPLEQPLGPQGGIAILHGNLAPDGA